MKIVFEGANYNTELLEKTLHKSFYTPNNNIFQSKVEYVGYYNNANNGGATIILPKVFLDNDGKAFGKFDPQALLEASDETKLELKRQGFDSIIFEFSTWIYQAITTFKRRQIESQVSQKDYCDNLVSNLEISDNTEIDIILSLLRFHKENKNFFTYIAKNNHSGRKIHWGKTISKKQPLISSSTPVYINTINKSKRVDFDEELTIIFYSTLLHIQHQYGFHVSFNENYELMRGREFVRFKSRALRHLRAIKLKYYSDKSTKLWKLLYCYFNRNDQSKKSEKYREEVLMVKNFNLVFEDMIDDLISDHQSDIPPHLKKQKDGKVVDHIYRHKSLILDDDIYFIGDSKYYKTGSSVGGASVAKQFTYAKNVIQYNIDIFNINKTAQKGIRYRDALTEGYNITPNFFISAILNEDFDFKHDSLVEDSQDNTSLQYHFVDRLFDRDTLLVQKYDINFLFVLSAYVTQSRLSKELFKNKAHKKFRARMIKYCNDNYNFYEITPKPGTSIETLVTEHFRLLNGKMYRPIQMKNSIIIALLKTDQSSCLDLIEDSVIKSISLI